MKGQITDTLASVRDMERLEEIVRLLSRDLPIDHSTEADDRGDAGNESLIDAVGASAEFGDLAEFQATIEAYSQPCMIVKSDGRIIATNGSANAVFPFGKDVFVDNIGLSCVDSRPILQHLRDAETAVNGYISTKVSFTGKQGRGGETTLMFILPAQINSSVSRIFSLFIADINWNNNYKEFFNSHYGLTVAEQDVMSDFSSGLSIREIAERSGRSISTVRSHFYSTLEKIGANSQTDLLRELYSVSNFISLARPMLQKSRHPHRKELHILRPHGRQVEVCLSGDFDGDPIVVICGPSLKSFPAQVEAVFRDSALLVISITRPGFGTTSPEGKDENYFDCVAGDVDAILSQLGIEECVLFSANGGFRSSMETAHRLGVKVKHVLAHNITLPLSFTKRTRKAENFLNQVEIVLANSKLVRRNIMLAISRAAALSGTRRILQSTLRRSPKLLEEVLQPDILAELDSALKASLAQGISPSVNDYERNYEDWLPLLERCDVPISWIETDRIHLGSRESYELFRREFGDRIRYLTVATRKNSLIYSEPEILAAVFRECFDMKSNS